VSKALSRWATIDFILLDRYGAIRRQDTSERYQQRQRELQERKQRDMQARSGSFREMRSASTRDETSSESDMDAEGGSGGSGSGLAVQPVKERKAATYRTTAQLNVGGQQDVEESSGSTATAATSLTRHSSLPPAPPEMARLQAFTTGVPSTYTSSSFAAPSSSTGAIPKAPTKQMETRQRQLDALRRMEERLKILADQKSMEEAAGPARAGPTSQPQQPASPPRRPQEAPQQHEEKESSKANNGNICSCHRLGLHVLDIGRAVSDSVVTWLDVSKCAASFSDAPEETILYSLVKARSELIFFGGIQKDVSSMAFRGGQHQQAQQQPQANKETVSNAVYFLRPPDDPDEW